MKYLALLRGINVGGKSVVGMTALKEAFIKAGFSKVSTYITSGNVLFTAEHTTSQGLTKAIEAMLEKTFFPIPIVVLSYSDLHTIVTHIPPMWQSDDVRKYIAFLKDLVTPEDVIQEVKLKKRIDFIDKGPGVVYMTTKMAGLTQSNFSKLSTKPIYKALTMRNYNTVVKLFSLMSQER